MENKIINQVKEMFDEREIHYYCEEEKGRIGARFDEGILFFETDGPMVECQMFFIKEAPQENRLEVLKYMNRINEITKEGHLEMDKDGGMRFRTTTDISETGELSGKRMMVMVARAFSVKENFGSNLFAVADGEMSAEEAFLSAMLEAMNSSKS